MTISRPAPWKRALRNSALITFAVGLVVHLQGETVATGIMTMVYTFAIITPALWLSYRFTDRIAQRNQQP